MKMDKAAGGCLEAPVESNRKVADDIYLLELEAPELAAAAKPGQFVMVRVDMGYDPLLRRPFSLHRVHREKGKVELLYQVVGRGTEILAQMREGQTLSILGPLGKGFSLEPVPRHPGIIGGGIGTAPLVFLAEELAAGGIPVTVVLGGKTKEFQYIVDQFRDLGAKLVMARGDTRGTALLEERLREGELDQVMACGPTPMLKKVADLGQGNQVPVQVSLEERMGCGVGACLGCACAVSAQDPPGYTYKRVCHDGPVFWGHQVLFDAPPPPPKERVNCSA